jgi:hypothetical protein
VSYLNTFKPFKSFKPLNNPVDVLNGLNVAKRLNDLNPHAILDRAFFLRFFDFIVI